MVQPFHPGVLNILYPYAPTLAKQRALKQRMQTRPSSGRFDGTYSRLARDAVPIVCDFVEVFDSSTWCIPFDMLVGMT